MDGEEGKEKNVYVYIVARIQVVENLINVDENYRSIGHRYDCIGLHNHVAFKTWSKERNSIKSFEMLEHSCPWTLLLWYSSLTKEF